MKEFHLIYLRVFEDRKMKEKVKIKTNLPQLNPIELHQAFLKILSKSFSLKRCPIKLIKKSKFDNDLCV